MNNVLNILRYKPCPVAVFPIGVVTGRKKRVVAVEVSSHTHTTLGNQSKKTVAESSV